MYCSNSLYSLLCLCFTCHRLNFNNLWALTALLLWVICYSTPRTMFSLPLAMGWASGTATKTLGLPRLASQAWPECCSVPNSSFLLMCTMGGSWWWLDLWLPHGRGGLFPVLAWPSTGWQTRWVSLWVDGGSVCFCLCLPSCLLNKIKNQKEKKGGGEGMLWCVLTSLLIMLLPGCRLTAGN